VAVALLLLGVLLAPAANAAHVNSTATLGPSQTGDTDGTGNAALTFDSATGQVCYNLTVANIDAPTAAHIHAGAAGSTGAVVVDFGLPVVLGANTCVMSTPAQVQAIVADPMNFYMNVHNGAFPDGAIRAQVGSVIMGPVQSSTTSSANLALDGAGFGDPDGSGSAVFTLYPDGTVCYTVTVANIDAATAAHIHAGVDGVQGAVVVNLDFVAVGPSGCVESTPAAVAAIMADPEGHYINVHNTTFEAGAIRGQLNATTEAPDTTTVNVALVATGDPDGSGTATFDIDPATGRICYTLTVTNIDAVTAAHIHIGGPAVTGDVIVNLDPAANGLMGCVFTSTANAMAIVNDLGGHYINVHTAAAPLGAIRAQLDGAALAAAVATPVPTAAPTAEVVLPQPVGPGPITNPPVDPAAAPIVPVSPAPAAAATAAPAPAAPAPAATTGGLAVTGSDTSLFAGSAFLLIGLGLAAIGAGWNATRRHEED